MGQSFYWNKPVNELIGERLALSIAIALFSLVLTYSIAIPLGLYWAMHQYTLTDNILTVFAFVGVGLPAFLITLVLMYYGATYFGLSAGGLFSPEISYDAPWSLAPRGRSDQAHVAAGAGYRHLRHGRDNPRHAPPPWMS